MLNIKNKKITIIGGQKSGKALAELVYQFKGVVKVSDKGFDEDLKRWADEKSISYESNGHTKVFIEDSDLIVLSPGVPINAEPVQWGQEKQIPVLGEVEFASLFCNKPIIAVSGSNGKTTVVTLLQEVLQKAGKKSFLCGNIGIPFSQFYLDSKDVDYIVLELSSFQLESVLSSDSFFRQESGNGDWHFCGFKPWIAVLLNFSQNHLDRHNSIGEYFRAKTRIFINQDKNDYAVLTMRSEKIKELEKNLKSKTSFFDTDEAIDHYETLNSNELAVLEVARILEIETSISREVFDQFRGVEHRLEWVRNVEGVDFFNDSKATTAEASRWAINNFNQPIVMICGGRDKNIDFSILKDAVQQKVKKMIVFGEAKGKLKQIFDEVVGVEECNQLEEAVKKAKQCADLGDCIILSPMCTSFDMFSNFEERGKVFKEIVSKL